MVLQFDLRKNDRINQQSILLQEPEKTIDQLLRRAKLGLQHSAQFAQHLIGEEELMAREDFTQNICAQAAGRGGAGENVGIQKDLHETSSNTSSSVR